MPVIQIQGQDAHYRQWGDGKTTILILHGWPADSTHYSELGPKLANAGFKVIALDFPGWGNTPPPPQAWTVSDFRDWVQEFVNKLELNDIVLFGHSFGGRVAIKFAIKYPYKIQKLILCAAAGIKPDPNTLKRRALKLTATIGKKAFELPGINKLAPAAKKFLYRAAGSDDYLKAEGVMKETIVKVLEEDLKPVLSQISPETLLVWGTEDGATPISDAKAMNELIPNVKLITFEGLKHNLPKNNPDKVAEAVIPFAKGDNVIE